MLLLSLMPCGVDSDTGPDRRAASTALAAELMIMRESVARHRLRHGSRSETCSAIAAPAVELASRRESISRHRFRHGSSFGDRSASTALFAVQGLVFSPSVSTATKLCALIGDSCTRRLPPAVYILHRKLSSRGDMCRLPFARLPTSGN